MYTTCTSTCTCTCTTYMLFGGGCAGTDILREPV